MKFIIKASVFLGFLFRSIVLKGSNLLWLVWMVKLFMGNEG